MKGKSYPFFPAKELKCKCALCGAHQMPEDFMEALVALRIDVDFPMPLSSAWRCPSHNNRVSSTGFTGPHTKGAVDVRVYGEEAVILIERAIHHGFTGIGVSQKGPKGHRFIHLDRLIETFAPRPWIWSY